MSNIPETPDRIEPCRLEEVGEAIADAIAELTTAATQLGQRLHPRTAASLADHVRLMNTYYSNLIEGHHTKIRDIERALAEQFDPDPERRDLQLEARAHQRVQAAIDRQYADGSLPEPASVEFIRWLHRTFYEDAPASFLTIARGERFFQMKPGIFRMEEGEEVEVGRHLPPSANRVEAFMEYFEKKYSFTTLGKGSQIIAMAIAHHRFAYIHPFLDGNGRVSRLMSHAMGLKAGIGAHGLWSISRGLARGLKSGLEGREEYKMMLEQADMPRQGDLDGRGNLSLKALKAFVLWFLNVCLDQIIYMGGLFALENLSERLRKYVADHPSWKPEAFHILNELLLRGEMPRGDAGRVMGLNERTARIVLSELIKDGIVSSETPKSAVFLVFPAHAVERLFPDL